MNLVRNLFIGKFICKPNNQMEGDVMRVDNYGQISGAYNVSKVRKAEAVAKSGKGNDTVEISDAAKTFQVARTAVASASDVRVEKVEKLKAAIEEGSYSVSGRQIADKLLEGYFRA